LIEPYRRGCGERDLFLEGEEAASLTWGRRPDPAPPRIKEDLRVLANRAKVEEGDHGLFFFFSTSSVLSQSNDEPAGVDTQRRYSCLYSKVLPVAAFTYLLPCLLFSNWFQDSGPLKGRGRKPSSGPPSFSSSFSSRFFSLSRASFSRSILRSRRLCYPVHQSNSRVDHGEFYHLDEQLSLKKRNLESAIAANKRS